jgi:hypothetical protein
MIRNLMLGAVALAALGLVCPTGVGVFAGGKAGEKGHHEAFEKCAKACTHCLRECESCAHHCAHLVAEGKKDHLKTLGTCADCADFCTAAARIVARHGKMAVPICESCAKACDVCGEACEKFSDDKHMARCAKACRECATECRAMIKHVGHAPAE